jgi:hypothetical protein
LHAKGQLTGMTGVYLVAAKLTKLGFIVSPTSRSARGADLLVTNQSCSKTFAVQVKTNASTFGFWLFGKHAKKMTAKGFVYVLVNLRQEGERPEFFVVPSATVARKLYISGPWRSFRYEDAKGYRDKWRAFGEPE